MRTRFVTTADFYRNCHNTIVVYKGDVFFCGVREDTFMCVLRDYNNTIVHEADSEDPDLELYGIQPGFINSNQPRARVRNKARLLSRTPARVYRNGLSRDNTTIFAFLPETRSWVAANPDVFPSEGLFKMAREDYPTWEFCLGCLDQDCNSQAFHREFALVKSENKIKLFNGLEEIGEMAPHGLILHSRHNASLYHKRLKRIIGDALI